MKIGLLSILFIGMAEVLHAQAIHVKATFYSTSTYCGGAVPPPELIRELSTPKPLVNAVFYLRRGCENLLEQPVVEEIRTNENGEADFYLWPGTYALVEQRKKDRSYILQVLQQTQNNDYQQPADKACLENWLARPDVVIVAKSEQPVLRFTHTVYYSCAWNAIPCSQYIGPVPP